MNESVPWPLDPRPVVGHVLCRHKVEGRAQVYQDRSYVGSRIPVGLRRRPPVDGPELFTGHHGDRDLVLGPNLYLCGGQTAVRYKNIRLVPVFSVL